MLLMGADRYTSGNPHTGERFMCMQCKGLTGCSKNGCTQSTMNRPSVAELLAQLFPASDQSKRSSAGLARNVARRESTNRAAAAY